MDGANLFEGNDGGSGAVGVGVGGEASGALEVELVGLVVVLVEEEDGFGGEVVDANDLCSLNKRAKTSRTGM